MRLKHFRLAVLLAAGLAVSSAGIGGAARAIVPPQRLSATAPSGKANLWVDGDGGSCTRSRSAVGYSNAAACGSIDAAWNACRPRDTIAVRTGVYGAQTITGNKATPGCTVSGENGTTIGDLVTSGTFFTLRNVTIDVGDAKRAGWKATTSNVTLINVRVHGPFVAVDISGVSNVRWVGGELGTAGQTGGKRVCGQDAEPVQIGDAGHITIDGVSFHPQDADSTPSGCSANGFHLEMIRIDGGTSFVTLRNSTFDNGDHSGTASIFITEPGGSIDPHDLTFENNFFGSNGSVGAFDVHPNVSPCRNFTFAYNTFKAPTGAFQCASAANVRWIGNLGANGPSSPCFGTFIKNVWQDPRRDKCGSDKWVVGARGQTDRLGLGGPDGFRLQAVSPAIDAGERAGYCITTLGAKDHDGQARPRGTRCDAGADERDTGRGTVAASLTAARWSRTASGARVLRLVLDVDEPVAVDVRLVRGSGMVAPRRYIRLRAGTRRPTLTLSGSVAGGGARLRIALEDVWGNEKVVQRVVRVPRRA